MGAHETTNQRNYLKKINPSAAYAKSVNLMPPWEVALEYDRVKAAQTSRRSKK